MTTTCLCVEGDLAVPLQNPTVPKGSTVSTSSKGPPSPF